jgi:hypothetical protein
MTSPIYTVGTVRCRIANHLWLNKKPLSDSNSANALSRRHYTWKPDSEETIKLRNQSKGYDQKFTSTLK